MIQTIKFAVMIHKTLLPVLLALLIFGSCSKDDVADEVPRKEPTSMVELTVPDDFNFETSKEVQVNFNNLSVQSAGQIKLEIFLTGSDFSKQKVTVIREDGQASEEVVYRENTAENKVAGIIAKTNDFNIQLKVPAFCDSLLIVRNELGKFSKSVVEIIGNSATYSELKSTNLKSASSADVDMLYGVNSIGDLFTIDVSTGELTIISELPRRDGSWACAIDAENEKLYTIGIKSPNKLYAYDIALNSWETIGNVKISGPRLGFNKSDGMLYFSTSNYVHVIDPADASIVKTYNINGLLRTSGGDLTFDADGNMYVSSVSGLFSCEIVNDNSITATYISSDNLPNYPNSLVFDSNDELWWASNVNYKGRVFIMDKVTGGWEDRFSPYTTYIHDLALLPYDENAISQDDSDGDGVIDYYDEYPDDPDKVSVTYTPSAYGWGTYGFEDLWPSKGDYDFNDLVVNYRYANIVNADGLLVETVMNFVIKNVGGSFKNGFGIEIDMAESLIEQVTGFNLTEDMISLNGKGLEVSQNKPVIIAFDNAWANYPDNAQFELTIQYTSPIEQIQLGTFNPFIFVNQERGREVHLKNMTPTDLADANYFGTGDDNSNISSQVYYKDDLSLPWAMDIIHDFVPPKEKNAIILGYSHFARWAESGGLEYPDWYKDKPGYRIENYLYAY
ncbi:LruC domain-containing protein [Marinilabiliaceae bacterium JC017]|nr:LruC domain-containing protein [Marinilabiliaceae bacterium JC017]